MSCGWSGFVVGRLATSGLAGIAVGGGPELDDVGGLGGGIAGALGVAGVAVDGVAVGAVAVGGVAVDGVVVDGVAPAERGALVGAGAAARACRDSASSLPLSSSSWPESVVTEAVSASTRCP